MISLTQTSATCALVEAVKFQPKNAHKTVHISYSENNHDFKFLYSHLVFRLTLTSGLKFAFDPTGAQNGWQETLAPWAEYERDRVQFITGIRTIDELDLRVNFDNLKQGKHKEVALAFLASLEGCPGLKLDEGGWEKLLHKLPDTHFETARESLVKAFRKKLMSYRKLAE